MKLLLTFIRKCSAPFLLICTFFFVATQAGLAQAIARAGLLDAMQIRPGVAVEIPINIEDVVDLYGIEIELEFDPTYWEFEDADPRRTGIQPAIGTFLDPGMTLFSIIDMQEGRIHLVMSQVNPSQPKSGDGTIMVLYATAKKTGVTSFEVKKVELATRDGLDIAVEGVDGQITIESQAPVLTATAIPVIDPTEIIIIPTYSPPTATPVRTATPIPTQTKAVTATNTSQPTQATTATAVNAPTRTATPIPVIDPIQITEIPTLDPSKIPPTPTPMPTGTPMPTRTATSLATQTRTATATATPKPTQTKATTVTNAPTRTATLAPTETRNPAATQITQPTSAAVSEVGGTPTAEPTLAEIVNTLPAPTEVATIEGRELAKGSALSLGKLLPWLISAIVLLIIAGVILFIRRKHINQPDQTSQEDK